MDNKSVFNDALYNFISKNRIILLILVSLITLGFLGLGIFALVNYQLNMDAIAVVDRAAIRYEKWNQLDTSAPQYAELEKEIKNLLEPFSTSRSEVYAGSKALWILSSMAEKSKNSSEQKEKLNQLLSWYPNSPYNIQATYKLAQLYLEQNNYQEAIKLYENLLKNRDIPSIFREEVIFSLGILYEPIDLERSKKYFDELVQTYPLSDWTKLVRSRIIYRDIVK